MNREGKIMTTRFVWNPEIGAGATPFQTVGRNAAATGAKVREQVRQFVAHRAIDFRLAVEAQAAIQKHTRRGDFCATSRAAQPSRPFDFYLRRERARLLRAEERTRKNFEREIAPRRFFGDRNGERKFELTRREHALPNCA
jgi:hypothetical protein